jgi:ubiquinone/menaquinone biosynthesis C-methylase UbiE
VSDRGRSFDDVAAEYERLRPGYPQDAVAWLTRRLDLGRGRRVLDLGAGTGKLTRRLVATGADVVAVEPGAPMLAQLRAALPEVEALVGAAESIPLPDASVDAVTAGQAYHWFDPERALPELHRVLRRGGGLGLVWNWWDVRDPLQQRIVELTSGVAALTEEAEERAPDSRFFTDLEHEHFEWEERTTPAALVARLATTSFVITSAPEQREAILCEVRELAEARGSQLALAQVTDAYVCFRRG